MSRGELPPWDEMSRWQRLDRRWLNWQDRAPAGQIVLLLVVIAVLIKGIWGLW